MFHYRMADELATRVIARHRRRLDGRARCITIDLDPTDDPTHGAQQYTLFNGYYDNWCTPAEEFDSAITGKLTGDIDPRSLSSVPRIPRVADETATRASEATDSPASRKRSATSSRRPTVSPAVTR